jgi:uncharacterized membrane protein YecN with MAPEG domain
MEVTPVYAGIFAVMLVVFGIAVVRLRWRHKVPRGSGDVKELEIAIRIHGNLTENIPLALILMGLLEYMNAPTPVLHVLGIWLVVARIAHAYSLRRGFKALNITKFAVASTWLILIIMGLWCLWLGLAQGAGLDSAFNGPPAL